MKTQRLASWIFGSAAILFLVGVFIWAPKELPIAKQQILAIISAILCGLFGFFFTGTIVFTTEGKLPRWGKISIKAGGGAALFVFVLLWWNSNSAPVAVDDGLVSPNFNSTEAVDLVKESYRHELRDYDLIDLIGSSYIFLKKPDVIFHRFPEWLCVFRHRVTKELVQVKLTDSRVPQIPSLDLDELKHQKPGRITYFSVSQRPERAFRAKFFDAEGRMYVMVEGESPLDRITEVLPTTQSAILSRMQIYGGDVENAQTYQEIERLGSLGTVEIRRASIPENPFYDQLVPIDGCKISVEEAIRRAIAKGAKGSVPDKEGRGGDGVVRLYNGRWDDLFTNWPVGPYWLIPYRIGIRPVLVNANNGEVYCVSDSGRYERR